MGCLVCRWLAYVGSPITLDTVLIRPDHSLIDQSLLARKLHLRGSALAAQFRHHALPTNGDGFGIAWIGERPEPGQYRDILPAWSDDNFHNLAAQVRSGCFLAHVRAAFDGSIARINCHPFVHGRWMFQHNGGIGEFARLKRALTFDVDPELYPHIQGTTDSEVCFFLALTYGLADDPVGGLTQMVRRVEAARSEAGVSAPFRATMAAADGDRLVVLRYASPVEDGEYVDPPTLFHSVGSETLHVGVGKVERLPDDAQLVVSEPLELHYSRRRWQEVPDRSVMTVMRGQKPVIEPLELAA